MTELASPRPVTPAGILAARLDELVRRAEAAAGDNPSFGDGAFRAALREAQQLAAGLEPYLSECTTLPSLALQELARRTRSADWTAFTDGGTFLEQEMLSGHVEGQVLNFLVRATRARQILEIGMFTGYSALAMAEALPDDGRVVACEIDSHVADFARECFRGSSSGHKIDVRVGPARDTLRALAADHRVFDFVFIDADKSGYAAYLKTLLSGSLLAPDGVICVDNTLMQGQPWGVGDLTGNGTSIAAFNRAVADDPRVEQVLLPLRDGLTLIRRAHRTAHAKTSCPAGRTSAAPRRRSASC